MAKKIDPKAKAKRQKIYAGVGGVILLGRARLPGPADAQDDAPARQETSSSPAPATTPRDVDADQRAVARRRQRRRLDGRGRAGGDGISDPDAFRPPQSGQLLAFGLFRIEGSVRPAAQAERRQRRNAAIGCSTAPPRRDRGRRRRPAAPEPDRPRRPQPAASGSALRRRRRSLRADRGCDLVNGAPRDRPGRRQLPGRGPVLQARLADEAGAQGRDRRRLARERLGRRSR